MSKSCSGTIAKLTRYAAYLDGQLERVEVMRKALLVGKGLVYQVHIQSNWPTCNPILVEGPLPVQSLVEQARMLWVENNPHMKKTRMLSPELFIRWMDLHVAVLPEDAENLCDKKMGFTLDLRMLDLKQEPVVFTRTDRMLSSSYAATPMRE